MEFLDDGLREDHQISHRCRGQLAPKHKAVMIDGHPSVSVGVQRTTASGLSTPLNDSGPVHDLKLSTPNDFATTSRHK